MAQSYTNLLYHCIFSTKGRERLITKAMRPRLRDYIGAILLRRGGYVVCSGAVADHIHLLLRLPNDLSMADAMRVVKANASRWIRRTFDTGRGFAWQTGYAAFTVSESAADSVAGYIENQEEHHRTRTFEEEYVAFLDRHGIAYEKRYLFA